MDKYIIVKVRDADRKSLAPHVERPAVTNLANVRKAIHNVAEMNGISVADAVVAHSQESIYGMFTDLEVRGIKMAFERAMNRAKARKNN